MFENWKKKRELRRMDDRFYEYKNELMKHSFLTDNIKRVIPVKLKYHPWGGSKFEDGEYILAFITIMEKCYSRYAVTCEYISASNVLDEHTLEKTDPDDFRDIIIPITREEMESKTKKVMDDLMETLKDVVAFRYSGKVCKSAQSFDVTFDVKDRSVAITGVNTSKHDSYNFFAQKYLLSASLWGSRGVEFDVVAHDIKGKVYVDSPADLENLTIISNEEFKKDDREYLEQKTQEFRGVTTRYAMRPSKGYVDVCKATVKKKYVYGDNDLFVEFELRHMNDDVNEVQTLTMEFNKFRNEYPLDEDPAREMPRTRIDL